MNKIMRRIGMVIVILVGVFLVVDLGLYILMPMLLVTALVVAFVTRGEPGTPLNDLHSNEIQKVV